MKTIGIILIVAMAATNALPSIDERSALPLIPWCGTKVWNHVRGDPFITFAPRGGGG